MKKINLVIFSVLSLFLSLITSCSKDEMDHGGASGGGLNNQLKSISEPDTTFRQDLVEENLDKSPYGE